MSWGWNEQSYRCVPAVVKVKLVLSPGFMIITRPPSSSSRTEWVKWSAFVHVTMVPAGTVMAVGRNM